MPEKKKDKELTHIQVKDNGLILAQKIGYELNDLRTTLQNGIINSLIRGSNTDSLVRYKIAQNVNLENFKLEANKVIRETKKSVKNALKTDRTVNLTDKQANEMSKDIDKGLLYLQKSAVQTYKSTLDNVFIKVKSASDLKEQLEKHIQSGVNVGVVYKNGREYKFDSYWEMKTRTDIQQEIGKNMVDAGAKGGVIFYLAAYFGDCAKDHVDYQGKIYYDKDWKSKAPKDRIDEIQDYIDANCEMSVQDVITEKGNYLTTRPNCRHYFSYMDIDSVLGAKTDKDVSNLRDKMNLNFNGKYQPEKYKALEKQRANERMIRAEKEEITKNELSLHLNPDKYKELQTKIKIGEANVRKYQAEQRELARQYDNIVRNYERESSSNRVDFGLSGKSPSIGRKNIDLTNKSNDDKIKMESTILFRRTTSDDDFKYLTDEQFNSLLVQAVKKGYGYERGTERAKIMIGNNSAANIADYMFFGDKVRRVDVFEEMYHCQQYREHKFAGMKYQDTLLEIDAKEYLLKNAKKLKLPRNEIKETKKLLDCYKKELKEKEDEENES